MNNYWNLNNIYMSFDDENYKKDLEFLQSKSAEIKSKLEENNNKKHYDVQFVSDTIKILNECEQTRQKLQVFNKLKMSVNTNDTKAFSNDYIVNCAIGNLIATTALLQKYITNIHNFSTALKTDKTLSQFEYILAEMIENEKYKCDDDTEKALAMMSITGSKAWQNLQNRVSSDLSVDFEGKEYPMTVFRNTLNKKTNSEKEKLFNVELKAYKKHDTVSAACINNIKGEAISVAQIRGYESPMDKSLKDCRMEKETINALFTSIEKYAPSIREFLHIKSQLLGYKNGLPFYEIPSTIGHIDKTYTKEQAKEIIVAAFSDYSNDMANLAKTAFDEEWIDFEPRAKKVYGGFCASVHGINESRILVNFNGSFNDIITIAHELGHAYHSSLSNKELFLNSRYPIPVAEIASTFAEMILMDYIYKTADVKTKMSVLGNDITRASQLTLDILSRFYFESDVFTQRAKKELSVEQLNEFMVNAQKKSFGNCIDEKLFHPYMWLNKEHYFYVDRSYYNFSYAFGFLLSVGFHQMYKTNKEKFICDYSAFLQNSGKMSVNSLCELMGINPNENIFWENALSTINSQVEEFKKLTLQ